MNYIIERNKEIEIKYKKDIINKMNSKIPPPIEHFPVANGITKE